MLPRTFGVFRTGSATHHLVRSTSSTRQSSCRSSPRSLMKRITCENTFRCFSSEEKDVYDSASVHQDPPVFVYPKSQALFEKITNKCSREEVVLLSDEIMRCLGRSYRQNEFYYKGFGGKKVKGGTESDAGAAPAVEEKTKFDLKLTGFDEKAKIKIIKEVRSITGLGLKEAKELVESAPKVVQKDMKKEDAEALKAKLEELGGQIELV